MLPIPSAKECISIGNYWNLDHPQNKGRIKRNMKRYRVVKGEPIFMESPISIDKKMREEAPF